MGNDAENIASLLRNLSEITGDLEVQNLLRDCQVKLLDYVTRGFPPADEKEVNYLWEYEMIKAVKHYHERTGHSLKIAHLMMDKHRRGLESKRQQRSKNASEFSALGDLDK